MTVTLVSPLGCPLGERLAAFLDTLGAATSRVASADALDPALAAAFRVAPVLPSVFVDRHGTLASYPNPTTTELFFHLFPALMADALSPETISRPRDSVAPEGSPRRSCIPAPGATDG